MDLPSQASPLIGTVLAVQANFYRVQLRLVSLAQSELLCTRRARLKKLGQQVMVGDRVLIEEPDWAGQRGAIAEVLPRHSVLERPPLANVDQVLLVFAMADPVIDVYQLSRFLVAIESTGLKVLLCLSKADLVTTQERRDWCDRLQQWGYEPTVISIQTGEGLEILQPQLQDRITALAGPSGVGKSSLINTLIPNIDLRVGEISVHWRKGKHTTRHVELFDLPQGGLLADTPGFSQPTLNYWPEQLIYYFPEGRARLAVGCCQFKDCLHRDEPGCVVQGNWERYGDYLKFLEEAIAYQTQVRQTKNLESKTKRKSTKQNGTKTKNGLNDTLAEEPKLDPKRYRRSSRRTQLQLLDKLYEDVEGSS